MSKIQKPEDLKPKETIAIGIYGQPGIGKTTLALSSPKPLLIDIDNGLYRVQPEHRCDSVQVKTFEDILAVLDEDLSGYDTIVIDTQGKLVDIIGEYIARTQPNLMQKDGFSLSQKAWGAIKNSSKAIKMKVFSLGKHLVYVDHEREEKEEDRKVIRPDISGSSGKDVIKDLDAIGYMEMIGKKRSISFTPSNKFYAKNSLKLPEYLDIDDVDGKNNRFLSEMIINPCIEKNIKDSRSQTEYNKVIAQAKKIIKAQGVTDETLEELRNLPKIGNSQQKIKAMLDEAKEKEASNA